VRESNTLQTSRHPEICGTPIFQVFKNHVHAKVIVMFSFLYFRLGCPRCPKFFGTPELLNKHYQSVHQSVHNPLPKCQELKMDSIYCYICNKSYKCQRDFANHKRRKDFCKPPADEEPPPKRRIGIIRRTL